MHTGHGLFLALEGGEGVGKSTQAELLAEWLEGAGCPVVRTREPGGTEVGARIRSLLLDPATGELNARTESLLYAADKAEHVDAVIQPALDAGSIVVSDRYTDSTLAYQGAGRMLDRAELESVVDWATRLVRPHLTIVLDTDPVSGLNRTSGRDRIEAEPWDFHRRVRDCFLDFARRDEGRYLVIDADQPPEQIHKTVRERVLPLVEGPG